MRAYDLRHLSDPDLDRDLAAAVARDRASTASVLAHIAEFDARKLYLPAAYSSMYAYCVGKLRLSEDAAYKRIQAARAARQYPAIFTAVAEGRLHLSAVVMLAPHLTREHVDELVAAATHQSKAEIAQLIAERFPRSEMLPLVQAIPARSPRPEESADPTGVKEMTCQLAPAQVEVAAPRSTVTAHAPRRFGLHLTIGRGTHDKLRYAQELLGHAVPSGDLAQVLDRALDALIARLERQKFATTQTPRARARRSSANPRHVPAQVRRAVWERDQGQCTFVSETGCRCEARRLLEYDHVNPVALGGRATVENIRLRCRAHNQFEADRSFGRGFMDEQREQARRARPEKRAPEEAQAPARAAEEDAHARAAAEQEARDLRSCLRELGFRGEEVRRAAEFCATLADATLEARVRAALKFLCPKPRLHGRVEADFSSACASPTYSPASQPPSTWCRPTANRGSTWTTSRDAR